MFIRENIQPVLPRVNRDLGNRTSQPLHVNKIFKKERALRRDLGNQASLVERAHMKKPLKCEKLLNFRGWLNKFSTLI